MSSSKKTHRLKTCPNKHSYTAKFNRNVEEVLKLDLRNLLIENKFNLSKDLLEHFTNKIPDAQALYQSIENVEKIIPNIEDIMKVNKNQKLEKKLFLRFGNEEFEENHKTQIDNLEKEKTILTSKINEKVKKLQICENEIANFSCDINIISNEEHKTIIDKNIALRKIVELKNLLKQKKNERSEIANEIKNLQNKKSEISKEKNLNEQKLYWHLLSILKEGFDTRKDGLAWVIKEIFEMDRKILLGYLPKFLDNQGIDYIFSQAKMKIKSDELDEKIDKLKNELVNDGVLNNIRNNNFLFNSKSYCKTRINMNKNNDNERKYVSLSKNDDSNNTSSRKKLKISSPNSNINHKMKIKNINSEEKKIYSYKNSSNSNKNFCSLNKINLINNDGNKKKYKLFKELNGGKSMPVESNNISKFIGDSSPYITNKNFYQKKIFNDFASRTVTNNIPSVLKLSEVESLIETNKKSNKNLPMDKLFLYQSLLNEKKTFENQQKERKKNEMNRIFNEYLKNDYYGRYGVEKNVVVSALIGGDNALPIINKQIKEAKNYFESLQSCSMNPNINDPKRKIMKQLENEKIKKIIGE